MADATQNQEGVPGNLRKQLAVAVRSVQWSYAIFWSLSATRQGVLEWGNGYYNGDIKTRKTVQAMELKPDNIGLQRTGQLRALYESLLEGETVHADKRPSVALSPEDLTAAEWYYLVCMSFVFNSGQGLPGRSLANGETFWLCNAQYADSKVFTRSLLAKSASIQTVMCFPHMGGVIELGTTELVPEDPSLLQHIKSSLLDFSKPGCSGKSPSPSYNEDEDSDPVLDNITNEMCFPREEIKFDREGVDELYGQINQELYEKSPDEFSRRCEHNHMTEDSFMLDCINGGAASPVQSWNFVDDDFSNGIPDSIHSSDCISEAAVNQEAFPSSEGKNMSQIHLKVLQESNHSKLCSLELGTDDDYSHYRTTVSAVIGSTIWLTESQSVLGSEQNSSFISWNKGGMSNGHRPRIPQNKLKKILITVPLMYGNCICRSKNEVGGNEAHISSDKKRENERFMVLRSMVPSISEVDKASILSHTIKYLKKLEARVEELESGMGSVDSEARPKTNYPELVEQICDIYTNKKTDKCNKPSINKRKASDIDETGPELNEVVLSGRVPAVKVAMKAQEVLIDMTCLYREYILLDIMDTINNLQLDAYSVVSSNFDGVLALALKSKFRGAAAAPAGMIKQALWKIAVKC